MHGNRFQEWNMKATAIFAELMRYNAAYLSKLLKSVTLESFFVRPDDRGNPLIWLLGHIVLNRGEIIEILGGDPRVDNLGDLFARGTTPENNPSIYPEPSKLTARFIKMSSLTDDLLLKSDPALLDTASRGHFKTVGQNLAYSYMHETHHVGQVTYIVNLPIIKKTNLSSTAFRRLEKKDSTAKILLHGIKSVFS
jgi:uncharacterized damage-inducible protein DinB